MFALFIDLLQFVQRNRQGKSHDLVPFQSLTCQAEVMKVRSQPLDHAELLFKNRQNLQKQLATRISHSCVSESMVLKAAVPGIVECSQKGLC